jgi:hypothetical protein
LPRARHCGTDDEHRRSVEAVTLKVRVPGEGSNLLPKCLFMRSFSSSHRRVTREITHQNWSYQRIPCDRVSLSVLPTSCPSVRISPSIRSSLLRQPSSRTSTRSPPAGRPHRPFSTWIPFRFSSAGKSESRRCFQHNLLLNIWVNDIDPRVGRVSLGPANGYNSAFESSMFMTPTG